LNTLSYSQRLRTHGFFVVINAFVLMVISLRYFAFLPAFPEDGLAITFIVAAIFGQMVLLAAILGLISIPVVFLPSKWRQTLQVLLGGLGVSLLYCDTLVFAQYRFHMNAVVIDLAMSGDVVTFPLAMWVGSLSVIAGILGAEFFVLRWLEKRVDLVGQNRVNGKAKPLGRKFFRRFALITFVSLLGTHGIHIWAAAQAYQPVTMVKRYLPLFYPATSNRTMAKYGFANEQAMARQDEMKLSNSSDLNYPLNPLKRTEPDQKVNIVLIVIDSWRADAFNAENTPHMWQYLNENAQHSISFENHLSTGNATRTGIFGLFYGIPGTYWHSVLANSQPPVLIQRLQELDYDIGVFAAAKLDKPEFDQTVFATVPNLRSGSEGSTPAARDEDITNDWLSWNEQRNAQEDQTQPAFSFLFYDSPHGYDFPEAYPHRFEPMSDSMNYMALDNNYDPTLLMNRYKTSVHYVDSQVKRVLDKLKETGDLANTLVIITGDHGQEINDNKLNFWGHNSNYTDAQIQVPFAMFGPKIDAQVNAWGERFTSHQDLVPTLAKNYLGLENDLIDYSIGLDLLSAPKKREWILASKYSGYGVITEDYIVEIGATGNYQLLDKTNRPSSELELNFKYLQEVFEQISLYSK